MRGRRTVRDESSATADGGRSVGERERQRGPLATIHRSVGNQAVSRVAGDGDPATPVPVSDPDGPAEREAERVARAIYRDDERQPQQETRSAVRRSPRRSGGGRAGASGSDGDRDGSAVDRSLRSAGRPLEAETRSRFENALGADLGGVRVHTDTAADAAARSLGARAFTSGRDVVFRSGEYRPGTHVGDRLLAHEVTHVLQQRQGESDARTAPVQRQVAGDSSEAADGESTGDAPRASVQGRSEFYGEAGEGPIAVVYFPTDEASLDEGDRRVLEQVADLVPTKLLHSDVDVQLDGYADKRGDADYNRALSHRRAAAVAAAIDRMLASAKANASSNVTFTAVAHGIDPAEQEGQTDRALSRFRRVEIDLSPRGLGGRTREESEEGPEQEPPEEDPYVDVFDGVVLRDHEPYLRAQLAGIADEEGLDGARRFFLSYRRHVRESSLRPEEAASGRALTAHRREQVRRRELLETMRDALSSVTDNDSGPGPSTPLGGGSATTRSFHNVRAAPNTNAKVIAQLPGEARRVTVVDKKRNEGITWFKVHLREPIGTAKTGDTAWITSEAVAGVASWTLFLEQLSLFELRHQDLSVRERITKLRQMSHPSDLPFDSVIGTEAGSVYGDDRSYVQSEWQLMKDYQRVLTPAGRVVDIYHVLVGLDVLPSDRREEQGTVTLMNVNPPFMSNYRVEMSVGPNYSAATWAGDIGAAVADAFLQQDDVWEREEGITDDYGSDAVEKRVDHYFSKRAGDADLLADVDAWQIATSLDPPRNTPRTVVGLLREYYENVTARQPEWAATSPLLWSGGGSFQPSGRRNAIERFLEHYGFDFVEDLPSQAAADTIQQQIETFAEVWLRNRRGIGLANPFGGADSPDRLWDRYAEAMTDRFLEWLEGQAVANNVTLDGDDR